MKRKPVIFAIIDDWYLLVNRRLLPREEVRGIVLEALACALRYPEYACALLLDEDACLAEDVGEAPYALPAVLDDWDAHWPTEYPVAIRPDGSA